MAAFIATFNNPKYNLTGGGSGTSDAVPINSFIVDHSFDVTSEMNMVLKVDITSIYANETSAANPAQLNSTVIVKRADAFWFRGFVKKKPLTIDGESGIKWIGVTVSGPDAVLTQNFCKDSSGDDVWTLATSTFEVTDLPLQSTEAYGNYQGATLHPDPDDVTGAKMYISDALSNTDTLTVAFNIGDDTIVFDTTDPGFGVRGWVKIGTEWIYFDGKDNAAGDSKWRLRNCVRGQLDTTEANHNIGATVTEKIGKIIAPAPIKLENDLSADAPDAGFIKLRYGKQFNIQQSLGFFVLPEPADGDYQATYSVYDEDSVLDGSSVVVSVNDVVETLLTSSADDGGPGLDTYTITVVNQGTKTFSIAENVPTKFTVGDFAAVYNSTGNDLEYTIVSSTWTGAVTEVVVEEAIADATVDGKLSPDLFLHSSTGLLRVTRFDYDPQKKPVFVFGAVQNFLQSIGLQDEIKLWYKHDTGKYRLRVIQNDTKFFSVPWVRVLENDLDLADIPSGLRLAFTDEQRMNRTSFTYSHHQEATGIGTSPDLYRAYFNAPSWDEGFSDNFTDFTAAGNGGMSLVADGKPFTKLGGIFKHNPGGSFTFGDFWFGAGTTPPVIKLDEIVLRVANYRELGDWQSNFQNEDKTWVLRVEGCDDYDTTTNTGTFVNIGFEMEGDPEGTAKWADGKATAFTKQNVNALRLVFDFMPGPRKADWFYGIVHDFEVYGNAIQYTTVNLTDDAGDIGDPRFIYAPDTFQKLRGGFKAQNGVPGVPRMFQHPIGPSSEGAAISLGRIRLANMLRLHNMRRAEYAGVLPFKPELGRTIGIDEDGDDVDDYVGVLRQYEVEYNADEGTLIARGTILDSTTGVLT